MPLTRRFSLALATAMATLVSLPSYAAVTDQPPGAHPAATPTRITPTDPASEETPTAPGAEPSAPKPSSASDGPSASSSAARSTFKAPEPRGAVDPSDVPAIQPSNRFEVKVPSSGETKGETWPEAGSVFTERELAQVIPGLTGVDARECRPSELDKGKETAHDTRCELALTIKGEPTAVRSRLVVNIRGFGAPEEIGRSWSAGMEAHQQTSSATANRFTFYRRGALGASGAYTDGTTAHVFVQDSGVAGEIWFSGIGFTQLKSGYLESRKDFRERVTPALVRLLATKMAPD